MHGRGQLSRGGPAVSLTGRHVLRGGRAAGDRNLGKAPTAPAAAHGVFTNSLSSLRIWGSFNLMVVAVIEETSFFSIL